VVPVPQGHFLRGARAGTHLSLLSARKIMRNYGLGFIGDNAIFEHVKITVLKYRLKISLAEFNKNLMLRNPPLISLPNEKSRP
jgi:hypothetical protein